MGFSKVAHRYAKSLLQLAQENGQLEAIAGDMDILSTTISESKELRLLLSNPIVKEAQKTNVLNSIFDGKVSNVTMNLIEAALSTKRESHLGEIADSYLAQHMELENKVTAEITTAVALNDELRAKAMSVIKTMSDKNVTLVESVDPDIIGGMIVKIGDRQIDASVRRRLNNFQQELSKNVYSSN